MLFGRYLFRLAVPIVCLLGLGSAPALAQLVTTFDFNFTYVSSLTAGVNYGTLTGSFKATGGPASYIITSMSGTLGGHATTLLAPGGFAGNDNALYYPKNPNYFTLGGVSFVANGINLNLYFTGTSGSPNNSYVITSVDAVNNGAVYKGTITEVGAPGPVPGAGLWSFGGLCVGGAATRYRLFVAMGVSALANLFALLQRIGRFKDARE